MYPHCECALLWSAQSFSLLSLTPTPTPHYSTAFNTYYIHYSLFFFKEHAIYAQVTFFFSEVPNFVQVIYIFNVLSKFNMLNQMTYFPN
jgi:hypothetical protein